MAVCQSQEVQRLAQALGFALAGVAPAEPTRFARYIRRWLDEGQHGEMAYLAKNLQLRVDPRSLLPGARSIICVADRYPAQVPGDQPGPGGLDRSRSEAVQPNGDGPKPTAAGPVGRVARYAWGHDYHRVIKKRLFQLADALRDRYSEHQYRVLVDTAPLLEREHAGRAGLGWVGKHTLLVHPWLGSWLLLGEVVTTLPVATDDQPDPVTDHCGTCTRCIDACPTGCLEPYQLDARRCISYLTIEHRKAIDPAVHGAMGNWVAGCDICQEVCPYNQDQRIGRGQQRFANEPEGGCVQPDYTPRPPGPESTLLEILNWDADARSQALQGSSLKRIKLDMFKRNALIAAGNEISKHPDRLLADKIKQLAVDPDESELVRLTAGQVLVRLAAQGASWIGESTD